MCRFVMSVVLVLGMYQISWAVPGELDTDFGNDGFTITTFNDFFPNAGTVTSGAKTVLYLSDGNIMTAGTVSAVTGNTPTTYFSLSRYTSAGVLDSTFGTGGRIITDFTDNFASADAFLVTLSRMLQGPDGKFVSVGLALVDEGADVFFDYVVAVYNTDGSLDTSFNPSGIQPGTTNFRIITEAGSVLGGATDVAIQSDNKIVISGIGGGSSDYFNFTTVRLNTDGSFDTSFNASGSIPGVSNINFGSSTSADVALSILYNPENDVIITGGTSLVTVPDGLDLAMAGYDSDGNLLSSFGSSGLVLLNAGGSSSSSQVNAMAYQNSENFITAGSLDTGFQVSRFTPEGTLDSTFGSSGLFLTDLLDGSGATVQDSSDMAIAADNKIFVTGSNNQTFAFIKLLSDGSGLDTSYNPNGTDPGFVSTNIGSGSVDASRGISLQSDGKVLITGQSNANGINNETLARYLGNTADVSIEKTSQALPGFRSPFDFNIIVSNAGPDTAEGVVVTDELPEGLEFVSASPSQGSCNDSSPVICSLGDIAINSSATLTIRVNPVQANLYTNTATVTVQSVDPDSTNNSSSFSILIGELEGSGCQLQKFNSDFNLSTLFILCITVNFLFLFRIKRMVLVLDKE